MLIKLQQNEEFRELCMYVILFSFFYVIYIVFLCNENSFIQQKIKSIKIMNEKIKRAS
jgi:hypothetical protein